MSETISLYSTIWSDSHLKAMHSIAEASKKLVDGYQIDYSKKVSNLSAIIKVLPTPYTHAEIESITASVENLAEHGWVIYFHVENVYQRADAGNLVDLENE